MGIVQFGGPLGAMVDPRTKLQVHPRIMGSATIAFDAQDDFKTAARASLVRHAGMEIQKALAAGTSFLDIDQSPAFASAIAASAGSELGVPLQIDMVRIGLPEQDADMLAKAAIQAAQAAMRARAAAAPAPTPAAHACPRCGATGPGKFCASCGSPMTAAPAAAAPVAPSTIAPPSKQFLTSGVSHAIAAGSQITVPPNHCFVGFANGAIAFNLQPGAHVTQQPADNGEYIRVTGLPFTVRALVAGRRLMVRGTWYVQDPIQQFRAQQNIDDFFGILEIAIGRAGERAAQLTADERQLCLATAHAYSEDGDNVKGTMLVIDAMTPA